MSIRELRHQLACYLAARAASGLKDRGRESVLKDFLRYLVEKQFDGSIPVRLAVDWAVTTPMARATGLAGPARRLSAARGFLSYLRACARVIHTSKSLRFACSRRPRAGVPIYIRQSRSPIFSKQR